MQKMTKWTLDQNRSEFLFQIRHKLAVSVFGKFKSFGAIVYTVSNELKTSQINFWIDVSSISTVDHDHSEMLKGKECLDLKQYELISFTSTTIGDSNIIGNYGIEGQLNMKGISKIIQLNVQPIRMSKEGDHYNTARFKITGKLNRLDWGIGWNSIIETTGIMQSEEVFIDCELELNNVGEMVITLESDESLMKSLSLN